MTAPIEANPAPADAAPNDTNAGPINLLNPPGPNGAPPPNILDPSKPAANPAPIAPTGTKN
jgi:hypothetical protein